MPESCSFIQDEKRLLPCKAALHLKGSQECHKSSLSHWILAKYLVEIKNIKEDDPKKLIIRRVTVESISKYFKAICIKPKINYVAFT